MKAKSLNVGKSVGRVRGRQGREKGEERGRNKTMHQSATRNRKMAKCVESVAEEELSTKN